MNGELTPRTGPGRRFVALAEEHAQDFATRADQHDREGSFPHENIAALQKSGFMAAPVPEEFGGLGLQSPYDHMVGMSRLARGCASTAIAANMHLVSATVMARIWRRRSELPETMVGPTKAFLTAIGAGQLIACVPGTEAGTDLNSPMAEVTPAADGGYRLNGHKIFGTLSPAGQILFSTARQKRDDGTYARVLCVIPRGTPGVDIKDNWDALGMRASGSGDIVYTDVPLTAGNIVPNGEWGQQGAGGPLDLMSAGGALSACFLGIAEEAQHIAIEIAGRRKGPHGRRMADRSGVQHLIAENEIDLFAARAAVQRYAELADAIEGTAEVSTEESLAFGKEGQCMKRTVERNAIAIVDRALSVSGGAGYMSKHPLSRLYRDVRAGPFMQPFGSYEQLEYIGRVALGIDPPVDR